MELVLVSLGPIWVCPSHKVLLNELISQNQPAVTWSSLCRKYFFDCAVSLNIWLAFLEITCLIDFTCYLFYNLCFYNYLLTWCEFLRRKSQAVWAFLEYCNATYNCGKFCWIVVPCHGCYRYPHLIAATRT